MKNTNRKIVKAAALSTVAATLAVAALPVYAEDADSGVTKNEDVFVVLNSDGSVSKTTVSDTLHSDSGFSNYDDKSNLTDAQNLKSTEALTKSSDGYVWNTADKDIYYQGTYSGDLPLGVSISYTLDGKSISEEDLLGKSGHVVITMDLSNNKYKYYKVNGKTYKVAMPIAAVTGAVMNKDIFSNVTVNEGNVTSDSSHDIVATVCLPGMKDSLESLVTANSLESIEEYLTDQVVINADVTDYEAPEMMLAASTDTDELKTELGGTDLSSVWGDMDKLQQATQQLIDGTKALYDGADQLSTGAAQLDAGAQQLVDGATSLESGADQVSAGAASLESGLGQLSSNSASLNAGASQIEESIFASASEKLNTELKAQNSSAPTVTLTKTNYAQVFASLLAIDDSKRAIARQNIQTELEAAAGTQIDPYVDALIYMASINSTGNFTNDIGSQVKLLSAANFINTSYISQYQSADAALKNANVIQILNAMDPSQSNKAQVRATIYSQVASGVITKLKAAVPNQNDAYYEALAAAMIAYTADINAKAGTADATAFVKNGAFDSATAQLTNALTVNNEIAASQTADGQQKIMSTLNVLAASSEQYKTSATEIKTSQSQLDSLENFVSGLKTYTNGVDTAYAGSQTLAAGASQVAEGASSLKEGASQLKTGIDTLSTGVNTLRDGAKTLMEGMEQYNSDGIAKITDSTEVSDIKNATQLLQEIKQESDEYNNYSGISDGTTGSVKFVYKVQTVKAEKDTSTASTNSDVTHVNDGSNFWSRLVDLFVFWN